MQTEFAGTSETEIKSADIVAALHWTQFAKRYTRDGERMHRSAPITLQIKGAFWKHWHPNKAQWMRDGFSISKDQLGNWSMNQWLTMDGKVSAGAIARAEEIETAAKECFLTPDYMAPDIDLHTEQSKMLYAYQRDPARRLKAALSAVLPPAETTTEKQILGGLNGNALDASDTGTGKTIVSLVVCAELGLKPCVIAPLAVLQSWQRAAKMLGVSLGWLINYDKLRTGKSGIGRWKPNDGSDHRTRGQQHVFDFTYLPGNGKHILIFDEVQKCFPFMTRILTDYGEVPIGEIVEWRLPLRVACWNSCTNAIEMRPIKNWWIKRPQKLVRVFHAHGYFDCTPDHRIYTSSGVWKEAKDLTSIDFVVCMVRAPFQASEATIFLRNKMLRKMENELGSSRPLFERSKSYVEAYAEAFGGVQGGSKKKDDQKEPDAQPPHASQGEAGIERAIISLTRREWEDYTAPNDPARGALGRLEDGACNRNTEIEAKAIHQPSEKLQGGSGASEAKAGGGSRWQQPQNLTVEVSGSPKRTNTFLARVVCVEILEPRSDRSFADGSPSDRLYDLEIEETHNFFAEGVLVHNCKAPDTKQGQILRDAARAGHKILGLSATAAKDPTEMRNLGAALGLHDGTAHGFQEFCKYYGCFEGSYGWRFDWKAKKRLEELHRCIFPLRGQRIRVSEVPEFPETMITADALDTGNTDTIKAAYEEMDRKLADAATKSAREKGSMTLAAIMAARVASEKAKLDLFEELAQEAIDEGRSPVIFLNFRDHIATLAERFKSKSIIWGTDMSGRQQKPDERQKVIDDFQQDATRICFVSLQAGGAGISLHDQFKGEFPRVALISPSYSVIDLKQALGRVHRAGAKTKSFQRIIFAAGTIEEEICNSMRKKLANIETINDGDMQPGGMAEKLAAVKLEGEK